MKVQNVLRIVAGSLALLSFTTPALAIMSIPSGWYLEANAGSTNLSNVTFPGPSSSSGIGGNANLGYKFMPFFAMEMGYTRYANTVIKNSAGTKAATDKIYSYDIAGKGIWPIMDTGFELFAKLGAQRLSSRVSLNNTAAASSIGLSSSSHSATGVYFGAGAEYYFMPELAVNAQWMRAQGSSSTGNLDLLSGGISFMFG